MSCKCAKFHSFIIKGTIFTPNCWTMKNGLALPLVQHGPQLRDCQQELTAQLDPQLRN